MRRGDDGLLRSRRPLLLHTHTRCGLCQAGGAADFVRLPSAALETPGAQHPPIAVSLSAARAFRSPLASARVETRDVDGRAAAAIPGSNPAAHSTGMCLTLHKRGRTVFVCCSSDTRKEILVLHHRCQPQNALSHLSRRTPNHSLSQPVLFLSDPISALSKYRSPFSAGQNSQCRCQLRSARARRLGVS